MKFLSEKPALLLDEPEEKSLILSDLHLGIEYEIYKKGINIPPRMEKQKKRILNLINKTDSKRLILLGDVKHNVPKISIGERERLPSFFESLVNEVEVHIIKGNHDGNIEKIVQNEEVEIHSSSGYKMDKFYFNHGHAWPDKEVLRAETLIRGHSHPALEFKDKLGFSSKLPCWLKCKINNKILENKLGKVDEKNLKKVITVPSFNKMISGMPVNREGKKPLLGPILKNNIIDIQECKIYLLDGTLLGNPKEI